MNQDKSQGMISSAGRDNSVRSRMTYILRKPEDPTKEEWDQHMMTHVPFRNWCPHCVRGRAVSLGHFKHQSDEKAIPAIGIDYMYINQKKE